MATKKLRAIVWMLRREAEDEATQQEARQEAYRGYAHG